MIDCERCWAVLQKIQWKTLINVLWFGECFMSSIQEKISPQSRRSRYLKSCYWNNQMRFLECLKSASEILHGNNYLWSMMKKSSVSRMQRFPYSQILILLGFGHNRRRTDGIRVEYFPRIHYIAACLRSPKVHEQNGRTRTLPRTNYLHVDVQWHHMAK